ncbi:unnamed protein product [Caenorhabditis nigoni]
MIIFALLIAISYGCAPSIPSDDPILSSTTTAPSTTSTDISNSTSSSTSTVPTNTTTAILTTVPTTTTIPTTTPFWPLWCCPWPFPAQGVNQVTPPYDEFRQLCNQTVTITCQNTNELSGVYSSVGILGNYVPNADYDALTITSSTVSVTASFACNTTSRMWQYNTGRQYSTLTCIWSFAGSNRKQIAQ